jgi:hypothetical protein
MASNNQPGEHDPQVSLLNSISKIKEKMKKENKGLSIIDYQGEWCV